MSNTQSSYQSTLVINSRQRQLQLQNARLKSQLKASHEYIVKLQFQIQKFRNHVSLLKGQNIILVKEQNNMCSASSQGNQKININQNNPYHQFSQPLSSKHLVSIDNNKPNPQSNPTNHAQQIKPPTQKSTLKQSNDFRQQLQVFTSESSSDNGVMEEYSQQQQQEACYQSMVSHIHPLGKSNKNGYFNNNHDDVNSMELIVKRRNTDDHLRKELTLNSGSNNNNKNTPTSLKKVDSTKVFRPLSYFDIDPCDQENSTFSTLQSQLSPMSPVITRSQRVIPNQQSKIKTQGRIREITSPQKVFKKLSIGKSIYDVFFVTGIGAKGTPEVIYSYPKEGSQHFQAILAICYADQVLRMKELSGGISLSANNCGSSKNIAINNATISNANNANNSHRLKQFYIIPLRKLNADSENEREYLTICEVEQVILVPKDNILIPCAFQRMYCFISGQQFFMAYKSLVNQFLDKIHYTRMQAVNNNNNTKVSNNYQQQQYKVMLKQLLQQPLSILLQKSAEPNHTLSYRLDQFVSVSIDVPSVDNSYKLVGQFRPWGVMNFKVQVRVVEQYINPLETKLFGLLITYVLSQKKVVLFSTSKSKVSQAILHLLQIIKPLQYVCPIIMTILRQDHEQYFSAPMSLILGLWVQQRKLQKQKIQIFMNRKQNLMGQIEKGKTHIENGIVINLDTGLVYGDGLAEGLTAIAIVINQYYENYCHHLKDVFKLFQKMFNGRDLSREETQLVELRCKLDNILKGTQLWTYFVQRQSRKDKFGE